MVGAIGNMIGGEKLSLSLYIFRCYLLYLYEILTVALYIAVLEIDSNFQILFDCQDEIGTFIPLIRLAPMHS